MSEYPSHRAWKNRISAIPKGTLHPPTQKKMSPGTPTVFRVIWIFGGFKKKLALKDSDLKKRYDKIPHQNVVNPTAHQLLIHPLSRSASTPELPQGIYQLDGVSSAMSSAVLVVLFVEEIRENHLGWC